MSKSTSPYLHPKGSKIKITNEQGKNCLRPIDFMEHLHQQVQEHREIVNILESHFGKVPAMGLYYNPTRHITMLNAIIGSFKRNQERKEWQSEESISKASRFCNIGALRSLGSISKTKGSSNENT